MTEMLFWKSIICGHTVLLKCVYGKVLFWTCIFMGYLTLTAELQLLNP